MKMSEIFNAWVSPEGDVFFCEYHDDWAGEFLKEKEDPKRFDDERYQHQILEDDYGYVRLVYRENELYSWLSFAPSLVTQQQFNRIKAWFRAHGKVLIARTEKKGNRIQIIHKKHNVYI